MKIFEKVVTKLSDAKQKFSNSWLGTWFSMETRWAWMLAGLVVGLSSCNWYNAAHSGVIMSIFYVVYYRVEYKKDHNHCIGAALLVCRFWNH